MGEMLESNGAAKTFEAQEDLGLDKSDEEMVKQDHEDVS